MYNPEKGYSIRKVLSTQSDKSCKRENTSTLPPLLIHSIDGIILRNTASLCTDFDVQGLHDCQMAHPNNINSLLVNWKKSICYALCNGKKTNKEYLEKVWLIPTLNSLKNYLDKDLHMKQLGEIDHIKKKWDIKWKKSKGLDKIIDVSDVETSEYNFTYE